MRILTPASAKSKPSVSSTLRFIVDKHHVSTPFPIVARDIRRRTHLAKFPRHQRREWMIDAINHHAHNRHLYSNIINGTI